MASLDNILELLKKNNGSQDEFFNVYYKLGQAYGSLGLKDKALAALDAALAAMPASPRPEAVYLMAKVYRDLGVKDKYQALLDILVKSTDPFWRQVAEQEMAAMKPDETITRLLEKANQRHSELL